MPVVTITMAKGRSYEQKKELTDQIAVTVKNVLGVPIERVTIFVHGSRRRISLLPAPFSLNRSEGDNCFFPGNAAGIFIVYPVGNRWVHVIFCLLAVLGGETKSRLLSADQFSHRTAAGASFAGGGVYCIWGCGRSAPQMYPVHQSYPHQIAKSQFFSPGSLPVAG